MKRLSRLVKSGGPGSGPHKKDGPENQDESNSDDYTQNLSDAGKSVRDTFQDALKSNMPDVLIKQLKSKDFKSLSDEEKSNIIDEFNEKLFDAADSVDDQDSAKMWQKVDKILSDQGYAYDDVTPKDLKPKTNDSYTQPASAKDMSDSDKKRCSQQYKNVKDLKNLLRDPKSFKDYNTTSKDDFMKTLNTIDLSQVPKNLEKKLSKSLSKLKELVSDAEVDGDGKIDISSYQDGSFRDLVADLGAEVSMYFDRNKL